MGAPLAAADVRQRLVAARIPTGVRWAKRHLAAAVCPSARTGPPTRLSPAQPAGRRPHLRIVALVRKAGATAAVGGADPARRADGVAWHERARGRLRSGL